MGGGVSHMKYRTIIKTVLYIYTIFTLSLIPIYPHTEESHSHDDANNTTITIKSVRNILGENNPVDHTYGRIRMGYISLSDASNTNKSAYALGGHFHLNSKKYYGWNLGLSAYTVLKLPKQQNDLQINNDFFNAENNSFILLTKAFLKGKWDNTEVILGRQIIDTPHADPDDIRMIPNYFEAYTIRNTDVKDLTMQAGFIHKMAGWENGVDASRFVNIGETLGTDAIDGVFYASALYNGVKDLSLSFWYYYYTDIANVLYTEAAYTLHAPNIDINLGLQYDASTQTGTSLLEKQNARTFGGSIQVLAETIGLHILIAYNKDSSSTGASSLNLGGGPLFTSMEDQTLDAMGQAGEAWTVGVGYHLKAIGIENLNAGIAYGNFRSDKADSYHLEEVDAVLEYSFNERFEIVVAYADIDAKTNNMTDYTQVRLIANYNF